MGCPRLYNTPEERWEARWHSSQKFYNKCIIFLLWWSKEEAEQLDSHCGALCKKQRHQYHKQVKNKKSLIPLEPEKLPSSGKSSSQSRWAFSISFKFNDSHTRFSSAAWSWQLSLSNTGCISSTLPAAHCFDILMRSSRHAYETLKRRSAYWRKRNTSGRNLLPRSVMHLGGIYCPDLWCTGWHPSRLWLRWWV